MENKTFKITAPEGYEIDRENSTIDEIVFKPVKKMLTYEDITEELFAAKTFYYINQNGYIIEIPAGPTSQCSSDFNNCVSSEQAEKLLALNMMMNVAKYLNDGWKVGDLHRYDRYYWILNASNQELGLHMTSSSEVNGNIYFKSHEAAREALAILGEDVVKTALSVDY